MKRICIDIRSLENDNRYRGIGYFVYHLVKNILTKESRNIYHLICANPKDNLIIREFGKKSNIKIILGPKPKQSYVKYLCQSQSFLLRLLMKNKFDTYLSLDSLPILYWPERTQFILIIHDLIPIVLPELCQPSGGKRLELFLTSRIARRADKIITISKSSKRDLVFHWHINPRNIEVIYEATDAGFKPISARQKSVIQQEFCRGNRYLLYIGEIGDRRKNVLFLIDVFSRLSQKKEFGDVKLLLVGAAKSDNTLYNQLQEKVRALSLNEKVIIPGFLPEAKLKTVLAGAEIFLFPSAYEGFGLPVLQACACGVPVIAFDNSSVSEIFSKATWLIPDNQTEKFTQAIETLLTDKKIHQQFEVKGLELAKNFNWQNTAKVYINLFD